MSNQTFVKKDRISFAVNSNEILTIAPINNNTSILFGSPNLNSNVSVVLSNQYIYADGTYLSNLPTGITTANLVSTVVGLGTVGYISTATGGLTQSNLTSTIIGLGTFSYISSTQLISTVTGLGSVGNPATWANYPAINTVNVAGNIISNADTLLVNTISSATSGYVDITSFINLQQNSIFGVNNLQTDSISANNYGIVRFDNSVDMNASVISNINAAYFGYGITTYQDGLYMQEYTAPDASVTSPALGLYANSIPFVGTSADNTCVNLYNVNTTFYCDGNIPDPFKNAIFSCNGIMCYSNVNSGIYSNIGADWWRSPAGGDVDINYNDINNVTTTTTENITSLGGTITVNNSHFIPSADDSYDLGSAINRWRELYVAGTSIHLGNSLVLSEDIDGKLSTNAMIVSSINVENLSTGTLTADTVYSLSTITSTIATNSIFIKGTEISYIGFFKPSDQETAAGAIQGNDTFGFVVLGSEDILIQAVRNVGVTAGSNLILNSSCNTFIGATDKVLVNAPETEILNNASISSINTDYISSGKGINLNNNAISNVLQITHISSATTNLCLPTYKLITTTNPTAYDDSAFTQILVNPNYFTHVMPFNKYRVQLNFNALLDPAGTSFSYFYFTLSNYNSTEYPGSIYSATRPYVYLQEVVINTAFNFTDMFDMSANPPNIGDSLYVLLYAKNYDSVSIAYSNINCFVITEPVV
jgi:hypothetical protein